MINRVLTIYASQMEQYMGTYFHRPEGMVEVGAIGAQVDEEPCKIQISLLNVERETAQGMNMGKVGTSGKFSGLSYPLIHVNLDVIIAAVFNEKRYRESLSVLSLAITFLQSNPVFMVENTKYTIEMITPSLQDQSNVWTLFGGRYYPSIFCKIRRLTFDGSEVKQVVADITDNKPTIRK